MDSKPLGSGLLEREHELATIARAIDELHRGHGCALIIEGEPGTGKTALLTELEGMALDAGCALLRERANELDASAPFGIARRLLSQQAQRQAVADGLGLLDRAELSAGAAAVEAGAAIIDELGRAIVRLAGVEPLVIVLDDAQWADMGSLRVLASVAERAPSLPVVIATAIRDGCAEQPGIAGLRLAEGAVRLVLADLAEAGTRELVRRLLPEAADEFVDACRKATAGNPLLLEQLMADFAELGLLPGAAAGARIRGLVPRTVIDGTLVRLARLGDDAVGVARAVAVLGDDAALRHVAALADLSLAAAANAAEQLVGSGLLTGHESLSYRHPVIAAAVLSDTGPFRVADLHRHAAALLDADGADELSAAHLLRSTPVADPAVVGELRRAAASALRRGDAQTAARFLARAVQEPPPSYELPKVLVDAAKAEAAAGGPRVAEWLERALGLVESREQRFEVLIDLARLHFLRTEFSKAAELAERALTDVEPDDPRAERAEGVWQLAAHLDPALQEASRRSLEKLVGEYHAGRVPRVPELLAILSLILVSSYHEPKEVVQIASAALELFLSQPLDGPALVVDFAAGSLLYMGALHETERLTTAVHAAAVRAGSIVAAASAAAWRGAARLQLGDLDGAESDAQIAFAPDRHGWQVYTGQAAALLALVRLERGDTTGAIAAIERAAKLTIPQPLYLCAQGSVRLAAGDAAGADGAFRAAGRQLEEIWKVDTPVGAPWRSGAAAAALVRGDRRTARDLAEAELALARRTRVPAAIANSLRTCAAAAGGEEAVALLRDALTTLDGVDEVLGRLRVHIDLGAALRRVGQRRTARTVLAAAREEAQRLSLTALATRAIEEQNASGARPRREWTRGPESLTPSERRIAERAGAGESNGQIAAALFLTRKTVEWHLSNVYRKLDISSRTELADALGSRVPTDESVSFARPPGTRD